MQQRDENADPVTATYRGRSRRIRVEPIKAPAKVRPVPPRETQAPKKKQRS